MVLVKQKRRTNALEYIRKRQVKILMRRYGNAIERLLKSFGNESAALARKGSYPLPPDWDARWPRELAKLRLKFTMLVVPYGIQFANLSLARQKAAEEIGVSVLPQARVKIDEWLKKVASKTTRNLAEKIQALHEASWEFWDPERQVGIAPAELAKSIKRLSTSFSKERARMIAVTDTNYAHNVGTRLQYASKGFTIFIWHTTMDDAVCPFCQAMDGMAVQGDNNFWEPGDLMELESGESLSISPAGVYVPPLHPYCACYLETVKYDKLIPITPKE